MSGAQLSRSADRASVIDVTDRPRRTCYSWLDMWCTRILVVLLTVVVWGLVSPVLMAASPCFGMGAMCEGPCGTPPGAVSAPAVAAIVELVCGSYAEAASQVPAPDPALLELPPK